MSNWSKTIISSMLGESAEIVANAIGDAAKSFALNGGALNLVNEVSDAAKGISEGKLKGPKSDRVLALSVLASMDTIKANGPDAGARKGSHEDRTKAAESFAMASVDAFVDHWQTAVSERTACRIATSAKAKETRDANKHAKEQAERVANGGDTVATLRVKLARAIAERDAAVSALGVLRASIGAPVTALALAA